MEYESFQLKDGRTVMFKRLTEEDLLQMMEVFNSIIAEGSYFPRNEGVPDLETARQWYHDHAKAGLFYLAAKVNGEFVGGATIEPKRGKESHIAVFGIYLKQSFRNMGIGTRLVQKIIQIARSKGFEMIELSVFSSNQRALHLYNKFGFEEVGRIKNGIKFSDGTYADEVLMVLNIRA